MDHSPLNSDLAPASTCPRAHDQGERDREPDDPGDPALRQIDLRNRMILAIQGIKDATWNEEIHDLGNTVNSTKAFQEADVSQRPAIRWYGWTRRAWKQPGGHETVPLQALKLEGALFPSNLQIRGNEDFLCLRELDGGLVDPSQCRGLHRAFGAGVAQVVHPSDTAIGAVSEVEQVQRRYSDCCCVADPSIPVSM